MGKLPFFFLICVHLRKSEAQTKESAADADSEISQMNTDERRSETVSDS